MDQKGIPKEKTVAVVQPALAPVYVTKAKEIVNLEKEGINETNSPFVDYVLEISLLMWIMLFKKFHRRKLIKI